MNSYAKFGGAARRHLSAICEKPMGGTYVPPPPAVRGLSIYALWRNFTLISFLYFWGMNVDRVMFWCVVVVCCGFI